ncbi:Probable beta-1,3-galactosyltransferase 2 [Linum perenne]
MLGKSRAGAAELSVKKLFSRKWAIFLCFGSFFAGTLFTNRMWIVPEEADLGVKDCNQKPKVGNYESNFGLSKTNQHSVHTLDNKISTLEAKLAAAKTKQKALADGTVASGDSKRNYTMVIGINTSFSSRKRRDSVRSTWMPQGERRKKLEKEKGIVIRFVIGHSSTSGGILDKAIDAEDKMHGDFLRLDHVEGYLELSAKTKTYFSTAVALWDADFYVKVDDDVHVNLATLGSILSEHVKKPRVYIGCMKSGPVLAKKHSLGDRGVKYHEPEYWKFGAVGNKYFRHATGQLYAISKEVATYISVNQQLLHKFANEDVSMGSWILGLDVEHVDERRLCCGTPPDCEMRGRLGTTCAVSFDWKCSGICQSVERMAEVHKRCGEDENAIWSATL